MGCRLLSGAQFVVAEAVLVAVVVVADVHLYLKLQLQLLKLYVLFMHIKLFMQENYQRFEFKM